MSDFFFINHKPEETQSHIPSMCDNQILLKRGEAMSKISCEPPDTLFVLKDRLVRDMTHSQMLGKVEYGLPAKI